MKFHLFISDFDGTLGSIPDIIEPSTVQAIKDFTAKGGKFVICTGRMKNSILPICKKYGLEGLVISYQGAMISNIETDECLFRGGINYQLAVEVAEKISKEGVPVVLHMDESLYYEEDSYLIKGYEKATKIEGIKIKSIAEFIANEKRDIFKFCILCDDDKAKKLCDKYNQIYDGQLICNSGSSWIMEIINPAYCKGFAVKYIADYYKIPYDKVIAIGDNTNDIPLINGEWYGVAVGDGREELKAVADEVTVPFKEKPVEFLLKKYCL